MKFAALISGGKDSTFNILECLNQGHELVALVNLCPSTKSGKDELDSYMYQSVGHEIIETISKAIGDVKLYRKDILGTARSTCLQYKSNSELIYDKSDEVEDLYEILAKVKVDIPDFTGVSSGAILSNYQRTRVENVCHRLNLVSLAYMWQRPQPDLLLSMIKCNINAILIKIAALGLNEKNHLGHSIKDVYEDIMSKCLRYGLNPCGEGGEYETMTLDAPFYQRSIEILYKDVITVSDDEMAPVKFLKMREFQLIDKKEGTFCNTKDFYKSELCKSLSLTNVSDIESIYKELQEHLSIDGEEDCFEDEVNNDLPQRPKLTVVHCRGYPLCDNEDSSYTAMKLAIEELSRDLARRNLTKEAIVYTLLCVNDMKYFTVVNTAYSEYFPSVNPPPRTCVQANQSHISLYCLVDTTSLYSRSNMHIRSLSHWAPANIGPYSQAVSLIDNRQRFCLISGQIAMHPENLELICDADDQLRAECLLSLRHVARVAWEHARFVWRQLSTMVCYVVRQTDLQRSVDIFHDTICIRGCLCSKVSWVQVIALPKGARVEWQATFSNTAGLDLTLSTESQSINSIVFSNIPPEISANYISVINFLITDIKKPYHSNIVIDY